MSVRTTSGNCRPTPGGTHATVQTHDPRRNGPVQRAVWLAKESNAESRESSRAGEPPAAQVPTPHGAPPPSLPMLTLSGTSGEHPDCRAESSHDDQEADTTTARSSGNPVLRMTVSRHGPPRRVPRRRSKKCRAKRYRKPRSGHPPTRHKRLTTTSVFLGCLSAAGRFGRFFRGSRLPNSVRMFGIFARFGTLIGRFDAHPRPAWACLRCTREPARGSSRVTSLCRWSSLGEDYSSLRRDLQ